MSEITLLVCLLELLVLIMTGACCPIELSNSRVVVKFGDPVSVNCSITNSEYNEMGWEALQGGMGVQQVSHLTWTVEKLTEWKIAPSCFINPAPDSQKKQCSENLEVVLYTFPQSISINSSSEGGGLMREGINYNFTCDIKNIAPLQHLTVRWYKGDRIHSTHTFGNQSRIPVDQSSILSFTPTRQDDGVKFRCEAHLDLQPEGPQLNISSLEYTVTVYFGPDVQSSQAEVLEGETLQNSFPVTGNPVPLVKWLKDGKSIGPDVPLRRGDAGRYTLEADGASHVEKEILVHVLYGPEFLCPSTYTAVEHASHNLNCTVIGHPPPKTIWYKDHFEMGLPDVPTRGDAGQYLITASNLLATVNHTVELTVTYPPSQIAELEDTEVEAGSDVWLKCSATGNPRPTYRWKYFSSANVLAKDEDGVSRLLIQKAAADNMGLYTCHASNKEGGVSKTVRVTVKGAKRVCPVEISPERMVVEHKGESQPATCEPTSAGSGSVREVSWRGVAAANNRTWLVNTHQDWDLTPVCTGTFDGIGKCQKSLEFTLYKRPDSVSIRPVSSSSLLEDTNCQLHCDVTNVAPARDLAVLWYHGNDTIGPPVKGSLRLTGCVPESNKSCDVGAIRAPVNVSSTISITLNRSHNIAEFRCEAELDLGPEGPQPPPSLVSSSLNISVYYKPTINTTKLPKTIPVFTGYPEELVCEADGHPPPQIRWLYSSDKVARVSGGVLTVTEAGLYNCSATNEVDSISHQVEVVLKEDYLPLIAGLVAITVVIISVIFIFIYSIYYKNTKMRRYSLKNPKLSTHNGNVAHNGSDLQFPMTKLS